MCSGVRSYTLGVKKGFKLLMENLTPKGVKYFLCVSVFYWLGRVKVAIMGLYTYITPYFYSRTTCYIYTKNKGRASPFRLC